MQKSARTKSVPNPSSKSRTYFPSKSFDDDLVALLDLIEKNGWSFSGVDLEQLRKDARLQRDERLAHDAAEAEWLKIRKEFLVNTEARYQRYSAALDAARGAFKHDKGVMAQLEKFRRTRTRRVSKVATVFVVGSADSTKN